jgi:uncharacterized protein
VAGELAEESPSILAVIAPKDRTARVEWATASGVVPDAVANRALHEAMFPLFREGRMADGVEAGLDALMSAARGERIPQDRRPRAAPGPPVDPVSILILAAIVGTLAGAPFRRGRPLARGGRKVAGGLHGSCSVRGWQRSPPPRRDLRIRRPRRGGRRPLRLWRGGFGSGWGGGWRRGGISAAAAAGLAAAAPRPLVGAVRPTGWCRRCAAADRSADQRGEQRRPARSL